MSAVLTESVNGVLHACFYFWTATYIAPGPGPWVIASAVFIFYVGFGFKRRASYLSKSRISNDVLA